MKKIFIAFAALSLFAIACGDGNNEAKDDNAEAEAPAAVANDPSSNPDYQKGLELIAKSDCLTCHKIDEKLTGPSYKDVAAKYAGSDTAVNYLSEKIIKGGSGVWGEVMMTPHPTLSKEDAEQMAKYILLLNN